jgi:hypothetical protein
MRDRKRTKKSSKGEEMKKKEAWKLVKMGIRGSNCRFPYNVYTWFGAFIVASAANGDSQTIALLKRFASWWKAIGRKKSLRRFQGFVSACCGNGMWSPTQRIDVWGIVRQFATPEVAAEALAKIYSGASALLGFKPSVSGAAKELCSLQSENGVPLTAIPKGQEFGRQAAEVTLAGLFYRWQVRDLTVSFDEQVKVAQRIRSIEGMETLLYPAVKLLEAGEAATFSEAVDKAESWLSVELAARHISPMALSAYSVIRAFPQLDERGVAEWEEEYSSTGNQFPALSYVAVDRSAPLKEIKMGWGVARIWRGYALSMEFKSRGYNNMSDAYSGEAHVLELGDGTVPLVFPVYSGPESIECNCFIHNRSFWDKFPEFERVWKEKVGRINAVDRKLALIK